MQNQIVFVIGGTVQSVQKQANTFQLCYVLQTYLTSNMLYVNYLILGIEICHLRHNDVTT